MSLLNTAREINTSDSALANRFFKGVVVDNDDPLKIGRVKVKVNGVHDKIKDDHIPWSMCASAVFGVGVGTSQLNVPEKDTLVWVLYCSNDMYSSLYFGGAQQTNSELDEALTEDYPNCYGWVDSVGNLFVVNKTKEFIKIVHKSGATIQFDGKGLRIITTTSGNGTNEEGLNIDVDGPINIKTNDAFTLDADTVNIVCNNYNMFSQNAGENIGGNKTVSAGGNIALNGSHIGLNDGGGGVSREQPEQPQQTTERETPKVKFD